MLEGPWNGFRGSASTVGLTERVVEIPWALSRYAGEDRVLDVGTTFASPVYVSRLRAVAAQRPYSIDVTPHRWKGIHATLGDLRQLPFRDASFDLVLCISTLEHIGLDNTQYGLRAESDADGDLRTMRELRRIVRVGGRIVVTVPFGRARRYRAYRQYDRRSWDRLLRGVALRPLEVAYWRYTRTGWARCDDPATLEELEYRAGGASAAAAVLCGVYAREGST